MLCGNCGHDNPLSRQYCAQCGQPIVPDFNLIRKEISIERKTQQRRIWAGRLQLIAATLVLILASLWLYAEIHSRSPELDSTAISLFRAQQAQLDPPPRLDDGVQDWIVLPVPEIYARAAEGFAWRNEPLRSQLRRASGGTDDTAKAVNLGLHYLADQQVVSLYAPVNDGGWPIGAGSKLEGAPRNAVGLNALALLAFLANGHGWNPGHRDPPEPGRTLLPGQACYYAENVRRAVHWFVKVYQDRGGQGMLVTGNGRNEAYQQAFATLALVEAATMTGDPELRKIAEQAVGYVVSQQITAEGPEQGGWGYGRRAATGAASERAYRDDPASPPTADVSLTAWNVLALTVARDCAFQVGPQPNLVFDRARTYLARMTDHRNYAVGYSRPPTSSEVVQPEQNRGAIAHALMARLALGGSPGETTLRRQADSLLTENNLPQWSRTWPLATKQQKVDLVYFYAGTLAMYWMGGEYWNKWNQQVRRILVENQNLNEGFWPAEDAWGAEGGRLYSTALCTLMLSTYYLYPNHRITAGQ